MERMVKRWRPSFPWGCPSLLLVFLLTPGVSLAQEEDDVELEHTVGEFDSAYIHSYDAYVMPRFLVNRKFTRMNMVDREGGYTLRYAPNKTVSVGLGATYKFATLNLSMGIMQPRERGRTRNLDLQINSYGRKITTDIIAQFYKGFYVPGGDYAPVGEAYYVRPDIAVNAVGGSVQYVFNYRRFSYRAAFQQTELQKRSAGTWLAGAELYAGRVRGDSTLVPGKADEASDRFRKLQFVELGPNIGYAYTWVYRRFFATAGASIALNAGLTRIYDLQGSETVAAVSPNSIVRLSGGYNSSKWAINVLYISTSLHLPEFGSRSLTVNAAKLRMNVIYRIYPTGRIKKAVRLIDKVDRELRKG